MTDKEQIIINGVDVSGCEYLTYELEEDGKYYWFCNIAPAGGPDECECKPECIYKRVLRQLARKTQENEELKEYIQANKATGICETCTHKALLENDCYHKVLKEIERICLEDTYTFADGTELRYDSLDDILDVINKAKDGNNE